MLQAPSCLTFGQIAKKMPEIWSYLPLQVTPYFLVWSITDQSLWVIRIEWAIQIKRKHLAYFLKEESMWAAEEMGDEE